MPNRCYQQVHIEGPYQIVKTLYLDMAENSFDHDSFHLGSRATVLSVGSLPAVDSGAPKTKWGDHEVEVGNWRWHWGTNLRPRDRRGGNSSRR